MLERPVLLPGIGVYRRSDEHLQVGLNPGLVIRNAPGLLSALRLIDGKRNRKELLEAMHDECPRVNAETLLKALRSARVLADHPPWDRVPEQHSLIAAALSRTTNAADILRKRGETVLTLYAGPRTGSTSTRLASLLRQSGCAVAVTRKPIDDAHLIVVTDGEPSRSLLYPQPGDSVTPISLLEGHVRWGPTMGIGGPCAGCFDAWITQRDDAWPTLMTQFGTASPIASGLSIPPAAQSLTLGHLCLDLCEFVDSGRSPLQGHIAITDAHGQLSRTPIPYQDACPCALTDAPQNI